MNHKIDDAYTWLPARIPPEIYDKIDSIARVMRVRRHDVVSAVIKSGLSISPYQCALDHVLSDKYAGARKIYR